VTRVLPTLRTANMEGALMSYQSFLLKGSTIFFLPPFFPLLIRLFLPTAGGINRGSCETRTMEGED
jgi:hypothetical protein